MLRLFVLSGCTDKHTCEMYEIVELDENIQTQISKSGGASF